MDGDVVRPGLDAVERRLGVASEGGLRCAKRAGLDPRRYAGHSLRAGLVTAAAQADVSERASMAQTGHKALPMVRRYIREGSLFRNNAAAAVGL